MIVIVTISNKILKHKYIIDNNVNNNNNNNYGKKYLYWYDNRHQINENQSRIKQINISIEQTSEIVYP